MKKTLLIALLVLSGCKAMGITISSGTQRGETQLKVVANGERIYINRLGDTIHQKRGVFYHYRTDKVAFDEPLHPKMDE